jgi:hypothetical protein
MTEMRGSLSSLKALLLKLYLSFCSHTLVDRSVSVLVSRQRLRLVCRGQEKVAGSTFTHRLLTHSSIQFNIFSDGSFVSRDPMNNCEFEPCGTNCPLDVLECPGKSNLCNVICWIRTAYCTLPLPPLLLKDGTFVIRDPNNSCQFPDCAFCTSKFWCADLHSLNSMISRLVF